MEFENWCTAKGFDVSTMNAAMKATLQAAWRAEVNPAPANLPENKPPTSAVNVTPTSTTPSSSGVTGPSIDDIVSAARVENERRQQTTELIAEFVGMCPGNVNQFEQIGRNAIDTRAAVATTRKELANAHELYTLRTLRPGSSPNIITNSGAQVVDNLILEAAVCRAGRLPNLESNYQPRVLEAVDHRFGNQGIGLVELIGMCAHQNGFRGTPGRNLPAALRAAFRADDMRADVGPSTLSISGILSATVNKFLLVSWMSVEQEWRKISAIKTVKDFKTITSYSLTGDLAYEVVNPGGQIAHGTLGNESYTNSADTYGKILGVDRRDLINDDLGALTNIGKRLGRGGALKLNEVFWTEFLADHSTFFPVDNSRLNYDAGTDTEFNADGLVNADIMWDAKLDPDNKPLSIAAKYILTPPSHKIAARRLMTSQSVQKDTDAGDVNPWAGMFEVVCSKYLANSAMGGGYSSLAWYLIADPNDLPVIETCFLNGNEMPTIETVEMDGDRLGMAMRGYHDFGVNKQEYRAALKLKGAA
jgi:hypothetical protein